MARPGQRPIVNTWSWQTASGKIKNEYRNKKGPKPITRREDLVNKELGRVLRKLRKKAKLNTYEASHRCMCSQPQLSYFETGKDSLRIGQLLEFCEIYNTDPICVLTEVLELVENKSICKTE